jgi:hypothetical protein
LKLLQFFAWLKTNRFAGRNRDFCPGAGITADTRLSWADVKDSEAPQFDAFSVAEGAFHALENSLHGHLGFRLGDAGPGHNFVYDVEFYQPVLPLNAKTDSEPDPAGTPSP